MTSRFTVQIESWLGAAYVSLLGMFFVSLIFIAMKNFNSDMIILDSQGVKIKTISTTERYLIDIWIKNNQIEVPEGKGYKYFIQQYPSKPWFR